MQNYATLKAQVGPILSQFAKAFKSTVSNVHFWVSASVHLDTNISYVLGSHSRHRGFPPWISCFVS
jgi:hypothetical protein